MSSSSGDYITDEIEFKRRLREMQLWNYAVACDLPGIPQAQQPALPAPNPAPSPTPAVPSAPVPNGMNALLKTGLMAASMATGGAGLLGGGLLLGNLFNKPAAPAVQPSAPGGQVTIGIDESGALTNPLEQQK